MIKRTTLCLSKSSLCLFLLMCLTCGGAFAQQNAQVSGTVKDAKSGETLPGVNVFVKGTTTGITTDIDGKFSLNVPNIKDGVLVISFVGYDNSEIPINNKSVLEINLQSSFESLNEVVVTGYGSQTKKEISGSVSNVTSKEFNKGASRDASDLLQGKVAGLVITQAGGDVTSDSNIRLRGTASLKGNSSPLIVIDGVPDQEMSSVAPQDIETISVLKDAASAAIYGSRSASGVILITTKKGRAGKTVMNYEGYAAFDVVANKPDMLNADQWRRTVTEMNKNNDKFDITAFDKGGNTDWFDELMRTGVSQNHSLSLSGGGTSHTYRASVAYMNREGVVIGNKSDRLNARFTFTQSAINDRLKISFTGTSSIINFNPANTRNFTLAYNMLPTYPVYNPDGSWFDTKEYEQGNPVRNQALNSNEKKLNIFSGNMNVSFDVVTGLVANLNVSTTRKSKDESEYKNSDTEAGRNDGGFGKREASTADKKLLEFTLNYKHALGEHKFDWLAGYSWQEDQFQSQKAQRSQFTTNGLGANNLESGALLKADNVGSAKNMSRLVSVFGRLNYAYQEKYLASLTVRNDGSSKFGKNHKWGTFPSASVAWRISQEDFMKDMGALSDLKFRAGYGITGNQDGLDPYRSLSLYKVDGTYLNNGAWLPAFKISQNANPNLKWESTSMLNVGVDYEFFRGRISGSVEWYNKKTTDMLYEYPVATPPNLYDKKMGNAGEMSNKGIEFYINAYPIQKKDFTWNISVNLAHNKNEITRLSSGEFTTESIPVGNPGIRGGSSTFTHLVQEGKPVGTFYGWRSAGLKDGKYQFYNAAGEIVGTDKMTDTDRTDIGSAQPKLTYGISNSFTYKNFDFSFFFRGVYGNDVLNSPRMQFATTQWLPGANILQEGLTLGVNQTPVYSSFYIEKGSFLRLDNLSLGYTINTDKIDWISKCRIYCTAQNLFVITKYKGLDPEVKMDGLEPGVESKEYYPKSRTFLVGINLSF